MGKYELINNIKRTLIRFGKFCVLPVFVFAFVILSFGNKIRVKNLSFGKVAAVSDAAAIKLDELENKDTTEGISVAAVVPDLTGMSLVEAKKTAENHRLYVGEIREDFSDAVKSGETIKQNPAKNTNSEVGSAINIVISKGMELFSVPKLTGISSSSAKNLLKKNKLKFKIKKKYSSIKKGNIIAQSVKPGKKVKKGTVVKISVSKGKKQVSKPKTNHGTDIQKPVATAPPAASRKPVATKRPVATKKPVSPKKPSSNKPKPADDDFDISDW